MIARLRCIGRGLVEDWRYPAALAALVAAVTLAVAVVFVVFSIGDVLEQARCSDIVRSRWQEAIGSYVLEATAPEPDLVAVEDARVRLADVLEDLRTVTVDCYRGQG